MTDRIRHRLRLGVAAALVVPNVRAGAAGDPSSGPGRYTMKNGRVQTIYGMVGLGFRPIKQVSVGGVVFRRRRRRRVLLRGRHQVVDAL